MIYEIKKAFEALLHPGINTNIFKIIRNAIPYYISPYLDVPSPLTIYWSINSVCNLRCKMCDVGMGNENGTFYKNLRIDKKLHEIDIKIFKSVIDEVVDDKPFIAINSTEPLLYKHIIEAIQYCTDKGLKTALTTGGYNLPKMAENLAKAGLKRLIVSIDGPSYVHNEIRGRKDSFERSIEGIRKFYEASQKLGLKNEIYVNYVISNLNYQYLTEFAESVKDLPITSLNYTYLWFISDEIAEEQNKQFGDCYPVTPSCFNEYINPYDVDIDVLYKQIEQLKNKKNIHFLPYFSKKQLYKYYKQPNEFLVKNSRCFASWFIVQILANGNVIPYSRCHNRSLGNINEQSFKEIWNGKKMKEWREFIKRYKKMPMCKRCDLIY